MAGNPLLNIPLANLSVGSHTLTATYSGDSNYASITFGNYPLTVDPFPTVTNLAAVPAMPLPWQGVALIAAVAGSSESVPTGAVTFVNGNNTLATVPLDSNGFASYMIPPLISGTDTITASYSGDANNASSTSAPALITVVPWP